MAHICHDVGLLENIWLRQRGLGEPAALSVYYLTSAMFLNIIVSFPAGRSFSVTAVGTDSDTVCSD